MTTNDAQKGLIIAFLGAFALSFDTLLLRMIGGSPLQMAFWRGLFMFVAGFSAYLAIKHFSARSASFTNGTVGIVVAAFYGLASICFVASAMTTSIANMLVIVATAPFWAAIGARFFLNERPTASVWLASATGFLGIFVVSWPGLRSGLNTGDGVALVAATFMAGAFVASRRTRKNLVFAPALGGLLSSILVSPFVGDLWFESSASLALMAIEGAILVPIALGLIAMAPRYLPAPQVGLFLLLETVLGPLWIWLALHERPSLFALLGGAIVITALTFVSLKSLTASRQMRSAKSNIVNSSAHE